MTDVALSPDGKTALSASRDNSLKLWDLRQGVELRSFTGHTDEANCVAISPDGLTAVSGSSDKTLKLWDLATGELRHTFSGFTSEVRSVAISPDGRTALSGSYDGTMKLWDLERRIERRTFLGHTEFVARVVFTPDGRAAFSGSHDGTLRLWDLESGKSLRTFGDANSVTSAGISPDGRVALSGSHGQPRSFALTLWNLAEGKERRHWKSGRIPVSNIIFAPDGRSAISDGWGTTMKSRDLVSGNVLKTVPRHQSERAWFLFDANSQTALAKNFGEKTLFVLDLTTGQIAHRLSGHADEVWCATLSRDGSTALSGSEEATLKLWDLASGSELRTFVGHSGPVRCVALSPDGRVAISGSDDKTLRVWDLESGKTLKTIGENDAAILGISVAADGVTGLTAGSDKTVKLWNLESGELLRTMSGHTEPVYAAKMTNDGRSALSTGFDKTVRLWDLASGKELRIFRDHPHPIVSIGIAPDGRTALSGDIHGNVWLWDFSRATAYRELERRVAAAQTALLKDTGDPHAEASLGEWYAFRGLDHWGMEFLLRARDRGVSDTAATLARCYWNLGQFGDAQREFQTLVEQSADTAQREYFSQCLLAVNEEIERARRREVAVTAQPLSEADIERISGLSATAQIAEIQAELQKRNPEFDGKILPTMENDWVIHLVVPMAHVTDVSPLRALTRLRSLELQRSADLAAPEPVDLASLVGLPLKQLNIAHCAVSDLAPLVGMPLDDLNLLGTRVSDLSSLRGMPLIRLTLMKCPVSDLSPLAEMPLETLNLDFT
ncbi:MAG: hypothetical protein NT069_30460, partial [Planctomycetota bacterium]|nr:hypothetical protein [Planctomycetota bacterium]